MWRATFFVYFSQFQFRNSFFDQPRGRYHSLKSPDTNESDDCDESDDSLVCKIGKNIEKKISIFKLHHIQTLNVFKTEPNGDIIWIATVKAAKEESETSIENRERAKKDFFYIASEVGYQFNLVVDGPHCNVSWAWIEN